MCFVVMVGSSFVTEQACSFGECFSAARGSLCCRAFSCGEFFGYFLSYSRFCAFGWRIWCFFSELF